MNDAPAREPVCDEFGAALLALLDEERVVSFSDFATTLAMP
jgi:hypothetical protein